MSEDEKIKLSSAYEKDGSLDPMTSEEVLESEECESNKRLDTDVCAYHHIVTGQEVLPGVMKKFPACARTVCKHSHSHDWGRMPMHGHSLACFINEDEPEKGYKDPRGVMHHVPATDDQGRSQRIFWLCLYQMIYGMLKHGVVLGSQEMHTYCIEFYKGLGVEFTNEIGRAHV